MPEDHSPVRILLVSGSTRAGSTNSSALRTIQALSPTGVDAIVFEGLADLPAFNPDDDRDPLPPTVSDLRRLVAGSDAVLFCVPEYAGALPGSFKNLLDWTVGGIEMYGKQVAWINVAGEGRARNAYTSLSIVLGYLGAAVIEPACVCISVPRDAIGADGLVAAEDLRARLVAVLATIVQHLGRAPVHDR